MFAGFNVVVNSKEKFYSFYESGLSIYNKHKRGITDSLENYINPDGALSEKNIENDWFPKIDAHVFISHSHNDLKFVISFAGWLYEKFKIEAFIDSCVWENSDTLLRSIDNRYCVLSRNENGDIKTYGYNLRNKSTSNVHMILYTALMKMIDRTECLMFVNTPSSVKWVGFGSPFRRAKSSNIFFWFDMELLSPCNSSSRLKRSYSGVIFSFLMAVPPEMKML